MYRDLNRGNEDRPLSWMYANNELDLNMLRVFFESIYSSSMAMAGGILVSWAPFIYNAGLFNKKHNGELNFFYDHIKNSIYQNSIINPNNQWSMLYSSNAEALVDLEVPLFFNVAFIVLSNVLVITLTRNMKLGGSHQK
jgi:hypothetical protein